MYLILIFLFHYGVLLDAQFCLQFTHSLSTEREFLAATTVQNLALFGGGAASGSSDRVDIYNATSGTWSIASLSQARYYLSATSVGDLALFGGGHNVELSDRVDIYNATSRNWSIASLSQARSYLSATTVGNLALFAGGSNATGYSDRVDIYNATSRNWSIASLSQARRLLAATTVQNLALFGGGVNATSYSNRIDIYNATSGTWSIASLSQARETLSATSVGDLALFGGGYSASSGFSYRVDIYNATSGTWSIASLSQARHLLAATTVSGLALFGGGENSSFTPSKRVDALNAPLCISPTPSPSITPSQTPSSSVSPSVTPSQTPSSSVSPSVTPSSTPSSSVTPSSTPSSSVTPSSTPSSSVMPSQTPSFISASSSPSPESGSGTSGGGSAIMGGTIAAIFVGFCGAIFAFFLIRRKQKAENGKDIEMSKEGGKGKGNEGKTLNSFFTQLERKEFLEVGIPEIDDLFSKVQAPLDTLCDMSDGISAATETIASLDQQVQDAAQASKAPFEDKLKLILSEALKLGCQLVPKLNGTEISVTVVGQESSQILQAAENINTLIHSAMDVVVKTPEIIQQLIELGETASEFPDKIKDMASSAGLSFMKLPKAIKNLSLNVKYLAAAPNDVKTFLESVQQLFQTIKNVFGIREEIETQQPTVQIQSVINANNNNHQNVEIIANINTLQAIQPISIQSKITNTIPSVNVPFQLVDISKNSPEFQDVRDKIAIDYQQHHEIYVVKRIEKKQLPITFKLVGLTKVLNGPLEFAFQACYARLKSLNRTEEELKVKRAYHGTKLANIESICKNGLLKIGNPLNPSKATDSGWFGDPTKGIYLSRYVEYTLQYSNAIAPLDVGERAKIIMFKSLPGCTFHVPTISQGMDPTPGYDSHSSPNWLEWYLFDESQCCPIYVIELEAIENTRINANDGVKTNY